MKVTETKQQAINRIANFERMLADRTRLYLVKKSITKELESITLKKFLLLDDVCKLEVFNLFRYLIKGR